MFGYIQANIKELKIREYETYRAWYCGLCHELKARHGRIGQLLLSYDMTFLLMLLSALYEPETTRSERRCVPHPAKKHPEYASEITAYAADMTILLGYRKAADDWEDEHSARGRALVAALEKDYRRTAGRYPRQAGALGRCVGELSAAERAGNTNLDYVAGLTGSFLSEMFVWKKDVWEESLRKTGFYLGKFIYMMDALDDREKDRKKGAYNIFNLLEEQSKGLEGGSTEGAAPGWMAGQSGGEETDLVEAYALSVMQDTMAHCCRAFEKLPIVETAPILRNILYAGVWVKYADGKARERDRNKKSSDKINGGERRASSLKGQPAAAGEESSQNNHEESI